jgi:hypothetical protein
VGALDRRVRGYHYRYATGHEGDAPVAGFSPRRNELSVYIAADLDRSDEILGRLGKHRRGKSCLYIKRLADVDLGVLEELVAASVDHMRKRYPSP